MNIMDFILLFSSGSCEPPWTLLHPTLFYILATWYPRLNLYTSYSSSFSAMSQGALLPLIWRHFWKQDLGAGLLAAAEVALLLDASIYRSKKSVHSPMHTSRLFSPCPSEVPPPHSIATWTIPVPR